MALESDNNGARSPPSPLLAPSPGSTSSVANSPSPACSSPSLPSPRLDLRFSIENILRPDFGKQQNRDSSDKSHSPSSGRSPASSCAGTDADSDNGSSTDPKIKKSLWPAWVYCTRYSDRPSSGPRSRKMKKKEKKVDEKRPRTAFTNEQLQRLKKEFVENRYLTERRRQDLAKELNLNESQIKIWFQNKRAKIKKSNGQRNPLAMSLMAQGLYNHSTNDVDAAED